MIYLATKAIATVYQLQAGPDGFYHLYRNGECIYDIHDDQLNRAMVALDDDKACYDNDDRLEALIHRFETTEDM